MVSTSGSVEYLCAGARGFINVAHSVAGSLRIFRSRPPGPVNLLCMAQSAGIMHDSLLRICAAEDTNTRLGSAGQREQGWWIPRGDSRVFPRATSARLEQSPRATSFVRADLLG